MPIDRDFTGTHTAPEEGIPLSLYPDYTVGPGIAPGLLSLPGCLRNPASARGLDALHHYRRWGITPRPENVAATAVAETHFTTIAAMKQLQAARRMVVPRKRISVRA
ncbi:hypothetical protein D9M68_961240 [compost metagenome]